GEVIGAAAALERLSLKPLRLGPKEGLALINGTQASAALALDALFLGERVFAAAIAAGALSVDALKGSAKPFDPRLSALRGQPGQIRVAAAIAGDTIAMALCDVGSISERRTSVLVDPKMSGLPAFLTPDSGVNSGLMIPQVTAAALVSENKSLAFPASVDSIPTSAGQEDHVSMAPIAARKACRIARNAAGVVAIELIAAAQGIDCHLPLKTSSRLQALHAK